MNANKRTIRIILQRTRRIANRILLRGYKTNVQPNEKKTSLLSNGQSEKINDHFTFCSIEREKIEDCFLCQENFQFKLNVNGLKKTDTTTSNWSTKQKHSHTHYIIGRKITAPNSQREIYTFHPSTSRYSFSNFQFQCRSIRHRTNHDHFIDIFVSQPHFVMHFVASHTIKYRLVRGMCIDKRDTSTRIRNIQCICVTLHYTFHTHNATISFDCRCSFNTNILRIFFNFLNTKCVRKFRFDYKKEKQKGKRFCFLLFSVR